MSVLPIYVYGQPVLRKKAKPVRKVDDELIKFIEDMFDTMHNAGGIGLAATQVGSLNRVLVVDVSELEETKDLKPMVLLNAEVVSGTGTSRVEEGCLSIPEIRSEVERSEKVVVRYNDLELKDQQMEAGGMLARVIMHEIDHLNGVLFIDHVDSENVKLLRGRLNKIRRGECEVKYPIVAESPVMAKQESK